MSPWRQSGSISTEAGRQALERLLEGITAGQVRVEEDIHRRLRSVILRQTPPLAEAQSDDDLRTSVQTIVTSFDGYRAECESILAIRLQAWRHFASTLLQRLAVPLNIDLESGDWKDLATGIGEAVEANQLDHLRSTLLLLLHRHDLNRHGPEEEQTEEQDSSSLNDNAAGLRGGGAALEHITRMLASKRPGYVAFFRLSCLDVIGERFGPEGMQDCLMTVASFLTETLRHEDTVYYWSESSLLAVCDRKIREEMISAELNRVLARNRDFTLQIGDRSIMLRIPIELQLCPLHQFETAEDVLRLSEARNRDRLAPGRF